MSDHLTLTEGDTAPALGVKVNANLTSATAVVAHIVREGATTLVRPVTVTDAVAGEGRVVWQAGDLTPGQHKVEVQVTFSDGSIQTFTYSATRIPSAYTVRRQHA